MTHIGEAVLSRMINSLRWDFIELCGLSRLADREYVCDHPGTIVHSNANLLPYGGIAFDGASCVDLVVQVREDLGVPFELKLGETRLGKSRIDEEWLSGCALSHQGKRFKGNMMSILERKFPSTLLSDVLKARLPDGALPLTNEWIIIARSKVLATWIPPGRPSFSDKVQFLSFEKVVDRFGGKPAFNGMVRELLNIDFYTAWVKMP